MILSDKNTMLRHKQFIAPFHSNHNFNSNVFVFRGITSTVSSQTAAPLALRELIVCLPPDSNILQENEIITENDKTNGYITYEMFRNLPDDVLPAEEKLFLANHLFSTLTFPAKTDNTFSYYRQNKARKYAGAYYLFAFFPECEIEPLKMELQVDALSQASVRFKYEREVRNISMKEYVSFTIRICG